MVFSHDWMLYSYRVSQEKVNSLPGMITHIGQAQDIINKIHEAKEKGEAPPIPVLYFDCLTPDVFSPPKS
jgi:hypothetical protein